MHSSRRSGILYAAVLLAAATGLFLTGARAPQTPPPRVTAAGAAAVPDLAGDWIGSWNDTIYGVSGEIIMHITIDGDSWSGTGSIDVSAIDPFLGVLSGTASGTVTDGELTFTFSCADLGNGGGTLADGTAAGAGTVTAPLSFGDFTFTGTAEASVIHGIFDFTSPSGGAGWVHLTQEVGNDAVSWSEVKTRYSR